MSATVKVVGLDLGMSSPVAPPPGIDIEWLSASEGVYGIDDFFAPPSSSGVLFRRPLLLPDFEKACYYAPFQKHAIDPTLDLWPEAYNQCHPLPLTDLRQAKQGGIFLLLKLVSGEYLAVLPLVTPRSMAWLRGDGSSLLLEAGHWGTGGWQGELPLLAWARNANPYEACEKAWRRALSHPLLKNRARMRAEKQYPEPLRYLGWCSWEEFKWNIGEALLCSVLHDLDRSPAPIRWVLIDDGHVDDSRPRSGAREEGQNGEVPIDLDRRKLRGLGVDARRFPRGWPPVRGAREQTKIRWMGVWLNFNGYWGGIDPNNTLGPLNDALVRVGSQVLQPKPDPRSARRFYDALIEQQQRNGFDFVKVDNQAKNVTFYRGQVGNAVEATMNNHAALEEAVKGRLEGIINCMAHNNLCAFSSRDSQVTRCSEDYKKGDIWRAKHHLNNSFANMLWLGQTVWGDHDMFHSSDPVANEVMARSKAISGGPIYLSDSPSQIRLDLVRPLCLEDGRLLQPLAPAVPLPESLFLDTYEDARAYRVIAPLSHGCVAVVAYNLTHPEKPVKGSLRAGDYLWAGALLQQGHAPRPLPAEGLLAYDVKRRRAHRLARPLPFEIPGFDDEFFLLCPIHHGMAIIGLAEKYLSPEGIRELAVEEDVIRVSLREPGSLLVWSPLGKPVLKEKLPLSPLADGLWEIELSTVVQEAEFQTRLS